MRIVISANSSWNLYNFRRGLLAAFHAQGWTVIAVAPPDKFAAKLSQLGCEYLPIAIDSKGASVWRDLVLVWRYWRLLRSKRPDVFLSYTIKPNIYGSLAAHSMQIPVVNNISGLGTAFLRKSWLTHLVQQLYRVALARSAIVFFQNGDDLTFFREQGLVTPEKTYLLPGSGVDVRQFSPTNVAPPASDRSAKFLLIARLLWDKGVGEFVAAARQVRQSYPNARFQLLGFLDVDNRTAIPREIVEGWVREGLVDYLGAADDVRTAIASADCVVLPSYREGTPRSLLEASAMGKPLIATNVPGCREVVVDGWNGYLCAPQDASDLARAIERFLELTPGERARMGANSRERAERVFDERLVIDSYIEAIERVTRASRVPRTA